MQAGELQNFIDEDFSETLETFRRNIDTYNEIMNKIASKDPDISYSDQKYADALMGAMESAIPFYEKCVDYLRVSNEELEKLMEENKKLKLEINETSEENKRIKEDMHAINEEHRGINIKYEQRISELELLANEIAELTEVNEILTRKNESITQACKDFERKVYELEKLSNELNNINKKLLLENEKIKIENERLSYDNQKLNTELKKQKSEFNEYKTKTEEKIESLEYQNQELNNQLKENENGNFFIRNRVGSNASSIGAPTNLEEDLYTNKTDLREMVEHIDSNEIKRITEIGNLRMQLEVHTQKITDMHNEVASKDLIIIEQKENIGEMKNTINEMKKKANESDNKINEMDNRIIEYIKTTQEQNEVIENYKKQLEEKDFEIQKIQQELDKKTQDLNNPTLLGEQYTAPEEELLENEHLNNKSFNGNPDVMEDEDVSTVDSDQTNTHEDTETDSIASQTLGVISLGALWLSIQNYLNKQKSKGSKSESKSDGAEKITDKKTNNTKSKSSKVSSKSNSTPKRKPKK